MVNYLCDCSSSWEDDLVCICFDSEEETDWESSEENLDNNPGDGTSNDCATSGFVADSIPVAQSCSYTADGDSFHTRITKGLEVLNLKDCDLEDQEFGGGLPEKAAFSKEKTGNVEHENSEKFTGNIRESNTVKIINQYTSTTLSVEAKNPNAQKGTLENDNSFDPIKPLTGCSTTDMEENACTASSRSVTNEWQFQEKDGHWSSYDKMCASDCLKFPNINMTVSQGMEKYCKNNPEPVPMIFKRNNHECELNLQTMTEHDRDEGIQRPICCVTKPTPGPKSDETSVTGDQGTELMSLTEASTALDRTPNIVRHPCIHTSKSKWTLNQFCE